MTALAKTTSWSIAPQSLGELMQFAKLVADSELVPKDYRGKPGNVVIAIQMGADVGLSPMQAIQSIAVINGRATLWGDTMLAVVLASPLCKDVVEMDEDEIRQKGFAKCIAQRVGRADKSSSFSIDDAKKAGLWGKQGPWNTAPARMLKMRARAFALRDQFSDVLRGIASAEEQQDIVVAKATVIELPKRSQEPQPAQLPPVLDRAPGSELEPKHMRVWALYANSSVVGQPITSIPDDKLASYIQRLEKTIADKRNEKVIKTGLEAQAYYVAALEERAERDRIKREDAEDAGADPDTGEVPQDGEFLEPEDGRHAIDSGASA